MKAFRQHEGIAAVIDANNVDTDQIIPSREMRRVSKEGLGDGLFAGWRYRYSGSERVGVNSDFVLNKPPFNKATILISGKNFGCGSSREHAVWALTDFGIRAVIAESFGRIFRNNCARNGVLAIACNSTDRRALSAAAINGPLRIDLVTMRIEDSAANAIEFEIADTDRYLLMNGLDAIGLSLSSIEEIENFREAYRRRYPFNVLAPAN